MLKTFSIVLLALTMSVGLAEARFRHHPQVVPGCTPGAPAAAKCAAVPRMATDCSVTLGSGAIPTRLALRKAG